MKTPNILNLLIFLTIRRERIIESGNKLWLPTHQTMLPEPNRLRVKMENAAGLKICSFLIAMMYLERIASRPAINRVIASETVTAGNTMRNKMRAVMREDSMLASALNTLVATRFAMRQVIVRMSREYR